MPQYIDVRRPMNMGQMAQLYSQGDPGLGSQAGSFVSQQAHNLGIGDPTNFFRQQQANQYNLAAANQGRQVDLARMAGQPVGPDVARNAQIDQASAMAQQQAAKVASLQQSQALEQYPIGAELRPLDAQEAQRLGQTPEAYTLNKRLGANRTVQVGGQQRSWVSPQGGAVDPETLFNHPQFQTALQSSAGHAADIFHALTGQSLNGNEVTGESGYLKTRAALIKERLAAGQSSAKELLSKTNWTKTEGWTFMERNPTSGAMEKRAATAPELEILNTHAGAIVPQLAASAARQGEINSLTAEKAASEAGRVASLQAGTTQEADPLRKYDAGIGYDIGQGLYEGISQDANTVFNNTYEGMNAMKTNAAGGLYNALRWRGAPVGATQPNWFHSPNEIPQVQHARQAFQQDEALRARYQALRARNPDAARRMIVDYQNR